MPIAIAVIVPAAAVAGDRLFGASDVAESMPAGALALAGTARPIDGRWPCS